MTWDSARIREIWDGLAGAWDRNRDFIGSFTKPISEDLLARLDARPGQTILEAGTGPGGTGFLVAERVAPGGRVICSDLSEKMLTVAKASAERLGIVNVEFRVLDVMQLDLPGASVDGLVARFVYHLIPDPARGFAEARRVIKPGGRFCFTVFSEDIPLDIAIVTVIRARGHELPAGITIPIELNNAKVIEDLARGAGFEHVEVAEIPYVVPFDSGDDLWRYVTELYGRAAALIRSLDPAEQDAFRADLLAELAPYRTGDAFRIPGVVLNTCAR